MYVPLLSPPSTHTRAQSDVKDSSHAVVVMFEDELRCCQRPIKIDIHDVSSPAYISLGHRPNKFARTCKLKPAVK